MRPAILIITARAVTTKQTILKRRRYPATFAPATWARCSRRPTWTIASS